MAADGGEEGGGEALLAIKERFRRNILKRLEAFDLSEEQKKQLRQVVKGVKGTVPIWVPFRVLGSLGDHFVDLGPL